MDKAEEIVTSVRSWANEKVYQPYLQPIVSEINEKFYQPYIEPVVSDINQYIYQPLASNVSNWWDQYGEWVHNALDAAGVIPGLGDTADGINALIYLAEGRYLEASVSAISMIPIFGDLGKIGKIGQEALDRVVKEVGGELVEKAAKEVLEEMTEKGLRKLGQK